MMGQYGTGKYDILFSRIGKTGFNNVLHFWNNIRTGSEKMDKLKLVGAMIVGLATPGMGVYNLVVRPLVNMEKEIGGRKERCVQQQKECCGIPISFIHRLQRYN